MILATTQRHCRRRKRRHTMTDAKSDAAEALEAHGRSIDELHQKLAATPGCDKERLARAVTKYKAAHQAFHDDALGCVTH